MTDSNTHVLDNILWHSLNAYHARFATGTPLAKRYPPDLLGGIVTTRDHSQAAFHDLAQIVQPGEQVALLEAHPPTEIPGWTIHDRFSFPQMVSESPLPPVESTDQSASLGLPDVDDMLQLVELTQPGPFYRRSIELGDFIGIRQNGQLIAMAGQRAHPPGYTEISGVCTHPDHQGKGYARLLVSQLVNTIRARGEVPFLHVDPSHTRSIELYKRLGFQERCYMTIITLSH